MSKVIDTFRGPVDPGGQPICRNDQPLELGFFAWNVNCGMTISQAVLESPERYQSYWAWESSRDLVLLAETAGLDYQVPIARWLGMGGQIGYHEGSLDALTTIASLAPVTEQISLFSTLHVPYKFHPLHIAKFGATIDHISKGRWGLNIVSGWSAREMAAFGIVPKIDHDDAYDISDEFVTLLKYLWAEDEPVTFAGKYFQAYGAYVNPKPVRRPRPVLMSAGNSEIGLDFACRQADWSFITAPTIEDYKARVQLVQEKARKYNRRVHTAAVVYAILDATDDQAQRTADWLVERIDFQATRNFIDGLRASSYNEQFLIPQGEREDPWYGVGKDQFIHIALGIGAWWAIGSYETVAEKLRALHQVGIESVLLSFPDPLRGLQQMQDEVIPLLKKMGLRK